MKTNNILDLIKKYGISIRQIPQFEYETNEMRHKKEGDEIVEELTAWGNSHELSIKRKKEIFDNENYVVKDNGDVYRIFCKRKTIPKYAGYWMCKIVNNSCGLVRWDINNDNLSKTLEDSILMLVNKIENKE